MDAVIQNQSAFLKDREKALKAEILKSTPPPAGGRETATPTKPDFSKMGLAEIDSFYKENPDLKPKGD
jgi:hypothetical protein